MAAKPRRKKRTSIRTAAGTVQDLFIGRMQTLRDNPTMILPECPNGEPKVLAKARARIIRMADGKIGFLDRRDKGIVGAVANAIPLADLDSVPRIADHKVGGKRRFYLQRGHVARNCSLGVQNFDDANTLLMAYRQMAKDENLHFFAGPKLWCTGNTPQPPLEWLEDISSCALKAEESDVFGCGHRDVDRVFLQFRDGPGIAICAPCARKEGNMHGRVGSRYAGPKQRQPVEVLRLTKAGAREGLNAEAVASYRAGLFNEAKLLAS